MSSCTFVQMVSTLLRVTLKISHVWSSGARLHPYLQKVLRLLKDLSEAEVGILIDCGCLPWRMSSAILWHLQWEPFLSVTHWVCFPLCLPPQKQSLIFSFSPPLIDITVSDRATLSCPGWEAWCGDCRFTLTSSHGRRGHFMLSEDSGKRAHQLLPADSPVETPLS